MTEKTREPSPVINAVIMETLETQLRENNPPETRATYERLKANGIDEQMVRMLLASVIAGEILAIMKTKESFNLDRFTSRLSTLPDMPWREE